MKLTRNKKITYSTILTILSLTVIIVTSVLLSSKDNNTYLYARLLKPLQSTTIEITKTECKLAVDEDFFNCEISQLKPSTNKQHEATKIINNTEPIKNTESLTENKILQIKFDKKNSIEFSSISAPFTIKINDIQYNLLTLFSIQQETINTKSHHFIVKSNNKEDSIKNNFLCTFGAQITNDGCSIFDFPTENYTSNTTHYKKLPFKKVFTKATKLEKDKYYLIALTDLSSLGINLNHTKKYSPLIVQHLITGSTINKNTIFTDVFPIVYHSSFDHIFVF